MVLGDGARDRGAACELISSDPATGAGVAFVRLEADPDLDQGPGRRRDQ
jgi:DNA segregation ATPase FtsK/SpoIIIE, S-DNA-T family